MAALHSIQKCLCIPVDATSRVPKGSKDAEDRTSKPGVRGVILVKVYSSLRKDIVHINCGPATQSFSSPFLSMSLEELSQRQQTEMEHPNNTLFGL